MILEHYHYLTVSFAATTISQAIAFVNFDIKIFDCRKSEIADLINK